MPPQNKNLFQAFGGLKADYAAMTPSRFRRTRTGITPTGSSADYHYRNETQFLRMREYVRAMDRDDALIGCSIDKVVQQHIQGGFRYDPQTADKKLNEDLFQRWDEWATDPDQCDVSGELEFSDFESLSLRHMLVDGDIFALPTEGGTLQMIEADQCRTPTNSKRNIVLGIELDEQRRRQTYFFAKRSVDPMRPFERVGDAYQIPARDSESGERQVFHVFNPKRVSQTRGVTAFHAIFDIAGMWEDTNFSLLVKQQIAACFGIFIENTEEARGDVQTGERVNTTLADGTAAIEEGVSPGMIVRLRKGQKATSYSPNIPSAETMAHLRMLVQIIAINLGIPLQLMLLDASETNFSGWRGAMDMAKLGFKVNQKSLTRRLHRRVIRWKQLQWAASDPALRSAMKRMGDSFFRHAWHKPAWPYIQPKDDADANVVRVQNFQASPRQIAAENGREFEEIAAETIKDNLYVITQAIAGAKSLKDQFGVDVAWRDVLRPYGDAKPADGAAGAAAGAGGAKPGDNKDVAAMDVTKAKADAYGVAVRAGAVTPQTDDEAQFRAQLQLPPISGDVQRAWSEDGGFRRPITLALKGAAPSPAASSSPPSEDGA